jgi:putative ABC transport system substrate-binding protein
MARDRADRTRRRFLRGSLALGSMSLFSGCGLTSFPTQRSASLRRIGYPEAGTTSPSFEAFREGMRDLGYVEGQNIVVEYRNAEANLERLPGLAAELVDLRVEIIVASNGPSFLAATELTSTIPIVVAGGDVVASGLVTNIAHPEGNITGVAANSTETVGKKLELLKETVPTIFRLAAVADLSGPGPRAVLKEVERAAQTLQLQFRTYELRDLDQLSAVLTTVKADGADGLVVVSGGILAAGQNPRIGNDVLKSRLPAVAESRLPAVAESRLPAVAESRLFAVNGGLLAHGIDTLALVRRSATYVDKILKGAKPGDLPIELPTTFDIVVNLKTAQVLGITVPQSVLSRAAEVIQ